MNQPVFSAGQLHLHGVTLAAAVDEIEALVDAGKGGYVVTPNVDHVVRAEHSESLRDAVAAASLSLADGMPLIWMSHLLGTPLPEKVSGSDLVGPLLERASQRQWSVYILGAAPGVGQRAAERLSSRLVGLTIAGVDAPPIGFDKDSKMDDQVVEKVRVAAPHLILVALGCPKQEVWMHRHLHRYAPAVALGIGATVDFIAGEQRRAPRWMSRVGLEWFYRLAREPRRMASRYLVRDREIVPIFWRMWRKRRRAVR